MYSVLVYLYLAQVFVLGLFIIYRKNEDMCIHIGRIGGRHHLDALAHNALFGRGLFDILQVENALGGVVDGEYLLSLLFQREAPLDHSFSLLPSADVERQQSLPEEWGRGASDHGV